MSGHVAPKSLYITIFLALMVGTVLTVAVTYVNLGAFNLTVALAIAITKAMLVILFFMHLKYSPKLIKVTFGASIFFFLIMVVITLSDYLTRSQMGLPHFPASGIQ
jgi:cytochrome c oxidase subunit IV